MKLSTKLWDRYHNPSTRLPRDVLDAVKIYAFRTYWRRLRHETSSVRRFAKAITVSARPIPPNKAAVIATIELYRRITTRVPKHIKKRLFAVERALTYTDDAEMRPQP